MPRSDPRSGRAPGGHASSRGPVALVAGLVLVLGACAAPSAPGAGGPAAPVTAPASPDTPGAIPGTTSTPSASATPGASATADASAGTGATPAPARTPSPPTSVQIEAIGLSEGLAPTGLTAGGSLEVPADPAQVAWFEGGGRPRGPGPTVVLGHVDSTTGPAVFARLTELAPGDVVTLGSQDGSTTRYVVDRVEDVPQDRFPTEAVFGATPGDELRLITCTGPFDRVQGYRDNRVVWASARG